MEELREWEHPAKSVQDMDAEEYKTYMRHKLQFEGRQPKHVTDPRCTAKRIAKRRKAKKQAKKQRR